MAYRHSQFNRTILVMLITVCATPAMSVETSHKLLEPGYSVIGQSLCRLKTVSSIECSIRCAIDAECGWFQYLEAKLGNCILIDRATPVNGDGEIFGSTGQNNMYRKECNPDLNETWTSPSGWSGAEPVVYKSFDTLDCLLLMEGTKQTGFNTIQGKINNALSLNHTRSQWVDLGVLEEACIVRPETCGSAGAAVALWIRVTYADTENRGIIGVVGTGPRIYPSNNELRFLLHVLDGKFYHTVSLSYGWIHVVLNYIGPNDGQGIRIYENGVQTGSDVSKEVTSFPAGDWRVAIGRRTPKLDEKYVGVDVDELLFFNEKLTNQQALDMKNNVL